MSTLLFFCLANIFLVLAQNRNGFKYYTIFIVKPKRKKERKKLYFYLLIVYLDRLRATNLQGIRLNCLYY